MKRRRLKAADGGDYFPAIGSYEFISTGCTLLDCVLGGGWVLGRISNIVGDKSTGKTLLAIEACANFRRQYPKGKIWYREAEAAFDVPYAERLGLPTKGLDFGAKGIGTRWRTVEDIFEDLLIQCKAMEGSEQPGLYIIDSLDALTSRAALQREVGAGSYNLEKQKILGELLGQLAQEFNAARMCVLIVSQVRDKIGIVFGDKHRRSGGKALDFYASQILWLSHIKNLTQTIGGVKRTTAVRIKAKAKKLKTGTPFRECEFTVRFAYGIEDVEASIDWLKEVKQLKRLDLNPKDADDYLAEMEDLPPAAYATRAALVRQATIAAWNEVEGRFLPKRRKYA